ncbi:MAG TPA: MXAN_6521/LA_1396 family lipoprotein [Myxococcota bacterium]|nr:MXAN_6521/LA_1396 family lipoprotein [Myxococcota bacterium]
MPRPSPLLLAIAALGPACSSVTAVYQQPGYSAQGPQPIKRIVVAGWGPASTGSEGAAGLGDVLAHVAADLIKLRKNYLVYDSRLIKQHWAEGCTDKVEGVLLVRPLEATPAAGQLRIHLAMELLRCSDGALTWRAEACDKSAEADADLAQLTATYVQQVGEAATRYAAPAFVVLQALVRELPDPSLTEEDINEKIELGGADASEMIPPLAQRR